MQKWLLNNTFYKPGGPIFFYTGNEGDVEDFATATGMMWDLAPRFNAAIIFAEHRFYGKSLPFGNNSYASIANMGYLTSEQALGDFAALLFELKEGLRAWAASAPLIYFKGGGVDQGAFDAITTKTFVGAGCNRFIVANSWNAILNLSSTASGRDFLNNQFHIDPKSQINKTDDGWLLNAYFREAIEYMAMVDYPYPTGFLEPLPGWPVKV
ncbi:hypothetical protein ANCDUO_24081 [Ancylostoma duodenale]|uniref:Serine carboxypeptidase S28 n=1 Tax=Ancylostoma duodenale TaxID=51022 RepID=A0A0C2FM09_9BILA|nr:hypothetical protein ANCDUO_24081 [Ancylostoma duodenale]